MELIKDWDSSFKRAIAECSPANYKPLLSTLRHLSPSMLMTVIDASVCSQVLAMIVQVSSVLDKEGHEDAVCVLRNVCETFSGMQCVVENKEVVEYVQRLFGSEEIADQVAEILIMMMRSSIIFCDSIEMNEEIIRSFFPSIESYGKREDSTSKQKHEEILAELKLRSTLSHNQ